MTTLPKQLTLPQAKHLQTGRIASSSRIAIACTNAANWLAARNNSAVMALSLRTNPWSTINWAPGQISLEQDAYVAYFFRTSTSDSGAFDCFVRGVRSSTMGNVTFGPIGAGAVPATTAGATYETTTHLRAGRTGISANPAQRLLTPLSFLSKSISVISYAPGQQTTSALSLPRSSTRPSVSAYEDDFIADDTNGSIVSVITSIKHAWRAQRLGTY